MKTIFYNGNIITLEGDKIQEAVCIENDIIIKIGSNEEILSDKENAEIIDLDGKSVIPAFIDSHGHLSSYAISFLRVQLDEADSFDDIIDRLRLFVKKNKISNKEWLIGEGYDHNSLAEKSHPTSKLLDEAFPETPVVLKHKSEHFGVFNSKALLLLGITDNGHKGYIEETAFVQALKKIPMPDMDHLLEGYKKAMDSYSSNGITTVQEGMMVGEILPLYQMLVGGNHLIPDVVGYPQINDSDKFYKTFSECDNKYSMNFRLGGYKIILDGSPQGRTAWMKTPYTGPVDTFGVSAMTDSAAEAAIQKSVHDGRQLLAHCNGDAAAEQFLCCAEKIKNKSKLSKIRPVMIHAQFVTRDQLKRLKELGIIPSFFVAHCYYWGDTHVENLGFDRASQCSPARSAINQDLIFTFHQDTPVTAPDMFQTIWCAVNRKTKSGVILGEDERISVMDALRAVTINAAYQYGEENQKGSITPGKRADFIITDINPLEVPVDKLRQISILQTYKSGKCIYSK